MILNAICQHDKVNDAMIEKVICNHCKFTLLKAQPKLKLIFDVGVFLTIIQQIAIQSITKFFADGMDKIGEAIDIFLDSAKQGICVPFIMIPIFIIGLLGYGIVPL